MLCAKCKTAVDAKAAKCAYCGSKIDKNAVSRMSAFVFLLITALIVPTMFFLPDAAETTDEQTETENASAAAAGNRVPVSAGGAAQAPETIKITNEEIRAELGNIAAAASQHIAQNAPQTVFLTNKGYLYNDTDNVYIYAYDLSISDIANSALLLYLRTSDLLNLEGVDIIPSSELIVFAAYETMDGFLLESGANGGGIIPRESLAVLINEQYNNDHGIIRDITPDDIAFGQIKSLLQNRPNLDYPGVYDIRYIKTDDKYAVVIASPAIDPSRYEGHILIFKDGRYSFAVENYASRGSFKTYVNTQLADINPLLIPDWRLDSASTQMRTDFIQVFEVLYANGDMAFDETAVFRAGTGDYCYIETESGRKLVGHYVTAWNFSDVPDYERARSIMQAHSPDAPIFILRR